MMAEAQTWIVVAAALAASTAGAGAGIGGAVLLVPVLLLLDVPQELAASLGLVTVAASSTAAAPRQLRQRLVNHRLAVTLELAAGAGAVAGALLAALVPHWVFLAVLSAAVVVAALGSFARRGVRNLPDPTLGAADVGERRGALAGAYLLGAQVVPYRAQRIPLGLGLSSGVGVVAGLTGTSGGYLKTPLMSEVMHVPVKVAAATTTLASGLTAVAALVVYVVRGDLDPVLGSGAVVGALAGGALGARLQQVVSPVVARRALSVLMIVIVVVLVWGSVSP